MQIVMQIVILSENEKTLLLSLSIGLSFDNFQPAL